VGERQRVATTLGEDGHLGRVECLDGKLHLDVPELADIEVTSSPTVAVSSALAYAIFQTILLALIATLWGRLTPTPNSPARVTIG